jgi:isopentenyl diphosphate isomerase/L-lactate dehydrogenase-like FMN-dependent dehydrogenase
MSEKKPDEWLTISEIVKTARTKLPKHLWDHASAGVENETTLRRNRSAFEYIAFRPRALNGVSHNDTSTTFLGHRLALPVMLAPVGTILCFHPDGALACARAAEHRGTAAFVGMSSSPSLETVRNNTHGPLFFQIYVRGDRHWLLHLVQRAERAGFGGICLTVDNPETGRRERDLINRFDAHLNLPKPNLEGLPAMDKETSQHFKEDFNWDEVAWLRERTRLPLILKGILSAEDAMLAVKHGVAVVYVSNHGGRELDHLPATIDVLPEIVAAVQGKAEVIIDSGFMRGTDVVKALALGARAVLIGKLMTWGLAAGGEAGLQRALELLQLEMRVTMGNIGVRTVGELGPQCVRSSYPPARQPWPIS